MNTLSRILLLASVTLNLHAQNAPAGIVPFLPGQAPAMLIYRKDPAVNVYIVAAGSTSILYKNTPQALDHEPELRLSAVESVYLYEPKDYRDALELYQSRQYTEAQPVFAKVKDAYKFTRSLPNNYHLLAGLYELECMRRSGDLEALAKAVPNFDHRGLTREHHMRQYELYALWDAVRTKSWERVVAVGEERLKERLPSYQRAQVAYCIAQAYEARKENTKALNAYNSALVADIGSTEEIAEQAAAAILRIHSEDEAVQHAMKVWGSDDENKASAGYLNLREAGAVAALYQFYLGSGKPLPTQFNILLKYKPEVFKPEPEAKTPAAPATEQK